MSEFDVYRRPILTSKVDPRTDRVKMIQSRRENAHPLLSKYLKKKKKKNYSGQVTF